MIRILNVLQSNIIGGHHRRTFEVENNLKTIQTIFIFPTGNGNAKKYCRENNLHFYEIFMPKPFHFNKIENIFLNLFFLITIPIVMVNLIRIIKKHNIDIVQTNGFLNIAPILAAYLVKIPRIWYLASTIYPRYLTRLMEPIIVGMSTEIVIISKKMYGYHFTSHYENVSLFYEAVDLALFNSVLNKNGKIGMNSDSERCFILGTIGNINPIKGYHYLIDSLRIVSKYYNVKLLVLGQILPSQKEYWENLQNKIKFHNLVDQVEFCGFSNDIGGFLETIDIFILSSIHEGGPRVTLEAMAMGLPIVATNVGSVEDQIIDGKNGYIVETKNSEKLAQKIIELISKPDRITKFGEYSLKRIKKFDISILIEKHLKLYNRINDTYYS